MKNRKPTHRVFQVIKRGEKKKDFWQPIGAAWEHESGDGLSVKLNAVPLEGDIVIWRVKDEEDKDVQDAGFGQENQPGTAQPEAVQ